MAISSITIMNKLQDPYNYLSTYEKKLCTDVEKWIDSEIENQYEEFILNRENNDNDTNDIIDFELDEIFVNISRFDTNKIESVNTKININLMNIYLLSCYREKGWIIKYDDEYWIMCIDKSYVRDKTIGELLE